jgi:hypothetical protein
MSMLFDSTWRATLSAASSATFTMKKFLRRPFYLVSVAFALNVAHVLWRILFHLDFL